MQALAAGKNSPPKLVSASTVKTGRWHFHQIRRWGGIAHPRKRRWQQKNTEEEVCDREIGTVQVAAPARRDPFGNGTLVGLT